MPSLLLSRGLDNCFGGADTWLSGGHSCVSFKKPSRPDTRSPTARNSFGQLLCAWSIRWDALPHASIMVCTEYCTSSGHWVHGNVAIDDLDASASVLCRRYFA